MRSISVRLALRPVLAKVFFFDRQKKFNLSSAYEFFDPGSYPFGSVTTSISITFAVKCHIVESTRISLSLSCYRGFFFLSETSEPGDVQLGNFLLNFDVFICPSKPIVLRSLEKPNPSPARKSLICFSIAEHFAEIAKG